MTSMKAFYKNLKRVRWVFQIENFQVDPYYELPARFMILEDNYFLTKIIVI